MVCTASREIATLAIATQGRVLDVGRTAAVTPADNSAITPAATPTSFVPGVVEDVCDADGELPPQP
jgi:hypothetical protein